MIREQKNWMIEYEIIGEGTKVVWVKAPTEDEARDAVRHIEERLVHIHNVLQIP